MNYNSDAHKTRKIHPLSFFFSCFLIFLLACQAPSPPKGITVQVQRVVSGQALEVLVSSQAESLTKRRVRLLGINAPDLKQEPWGSAAKKRLRELVGQEKRGNLVLQSVSLELGEPETDQFGRLLAYVWHDGVLVNEELVEQGYVLADESAPLKTKYSQKLLRAQEYARLMGYGIWNPKQPMGLTPQEFRSKSVLQYKSK